MKNMFYSIITEARAEDHTVFWCVNLPKLTLVMVIRKDLGLLDIVEHDALVRAQWRKRMPYSGMTYSFFPLYDCKFICLFV